MIDCTSLPSFGSIVPNGPLIIVVVDDDVVDDGYETLSVDRDPCIVLREKCIAIGFASGSRIQSNDPLLLPSLGNVRDRSS